ARGFWLLEYLGHDDVHVLDGGFHAWQAACYPVTKEPQRVQGVQVSSHTRGQLIISADDLHGLLSAEDVAVLDSRTDGEYTGRQVRAARGGTIPGAIHIEWTQNLDEHGAFK